jgi:hypothetical protein
MGWLFWVLRLGCVAAGCMLVLQAEQFMKKINFVYQKI